MANVNDIIKDKFVCPKCGERHPHVEKLAMSGTGLSRLFEVQQYRYTFVSCNNCGFTEVYNSRVLEGKDNLGTFLEVLFSN